MRVDVWAELGDPENASAFADAVRRIVAEYTAGNLTLEEARWFAGTSKKERAILCGEEIEDLQERGDHFVSVAFMRRGLPDAAWLG